MERGLDIALSCAARGWIVFPVRVADGKKTPLVKWKTAATTDVSTIVQFWALYPNAYCGVITGKSSNLYVVDIDNPGALNQFSSSYRNLLGQGIISLTPRGAHYYFSSPIDHEEVRNSAYNGLDVRGDGGMIVCYHSLDHDATLVSLPLKIAYWARNRTRRHNTTVNGSVVPEVINWPGGGSDAWVVSVIGSFMARGLRAEAALAALIAENDYGRFAPPCDVEWLAAKVSHMYESYEVGNTHANVLAALRKMGR